MVIDMEYLHQADFVVKVHGFRLDVLGREGRLLQVMRKVWHNVIFKKCLAFFGSGGLLVVGEAWLLSLVVLEGVHSGLDLLSVFEIIVIILIIILYNTALF